jgi:hypothetical protein
MEAHRQMYIFPPEAQPKINSDISYPIPLIDSLVQITTAEQLISDQGMARHPAFQD